MKALIDSRHKKRLLRFFYFMYSQEHALWDYIGTI